MKTDMTKGNPMKIILMFSIPVLMGNLFQQFYNVVDSIVAGQFIGVDALAAIGSTGSLMFFVTGWLNGLSSGFAIIVAQRFGAKKYEDMRHFVAMSIYLMMGFAVAMTIGFLVFNIPILALRSQSASRPGRRSGSSSASSPPRSRPSASSTCSTSTATRTFSAPSSPRIRSCRPCATCWT